MEETASIAEVIAGLPKPATRQIHVLVKVPKQSEELESPSFSWRAPRPLLSPAGANWDFQNPLDLGAISKAIKRHFDAWKRGATDQESHPLFVCVDGAGTGKSRLVNEFPAVVQRLNFSGRGDAKGGGRRSGDKLEMRTLLQKTFTFKVTLTNMTTSQADFADPNHAIEARMLFQLQNDVDWPSFLKNPANHVTPGQVLAKLSEITGTSLGDMFSQPVKECLSASPTQWCFHVQTAELSRPTINGKDVFEAFEIEMDAALLQLLIDGMGGFGRALEELKLEFASVLRCVINAVQAAYPAVDFRVNAMSATFMAVVARRVVDDSSRFGSSSLDEGMSSGLLRLRNRRLECPYMLCLLLPPEPFGPWRTYVPSEKREQEDWKPWQGWEHFNCKVRVLKSMACAREEVPLRWTDLHCGARFGQGYDRVVRELPRTSVCCLEQMTTKSNGFSRDECSCGNESRFLYLSADHESPASFVCMEDTERGFFHEVHQHKCTDEDLSLKALDEAKSNAAGPEDLFLLYSTGDVSCDVSSLRSFAVVDRSCWQTYYGPFAACALFIQTAPAPCLDTSPVELLSLVQGVNSAHSELLAKKRPFSSYADAHEHTEIPISILKRFRLKLSKS